MALVISSMSIYITGRLFKDGVNCKLGSGVFLSPRPGVTFNPALQIEYTTTRYDIFFNAFNFVKKYIHLLLRLSGYFFG